MRLLRMDTPAEIRRRVDFSTPAQSGVRDIFVAKGPLVILAHGLLAVDPHGDKGCRITGPMGDMSPAQARAMLKEWMGGRVVDLPASRRPRRAPAPMKRAG